MKLLTIVGVRPQFIKAAMVTGAIINAGTRVGTGTFVGSNSVTREYIEIGDNQVIGFGSKTTNHIEKALGNGIKRPSPSEAKNKIIARKSLVAAQPIKAGERFSSDNITAKRPGSGISPMRWDEVLVQVAQKDYEKDELI